MMRRMEIISLKLIYQVTRQADGNPLEPAFTCIGRRCLVQFWEQRPLGWRGQMIITFHLCFLSHLSPNAPSGRPQSRVCLFPCRRSLLRSMPFYSIPDNQPSHHKPLPIRYDPYAPKSSGRPLERASYSQS